MKEPILDGDDSSGQRSPNIVLLFFEQVFIMCQKHFTQKQRNGRQFLKDSVMIQFFILAFSGYILYSASTQYPSPYTYDLFELPPLSKAASNGVFNPSGPGNEATYQLSERLYYSPNNHAGVQALMNALTKKYPDVVTVGAADNAGINNLYETNLFDTWAAIQFDLSEEQLSSGTFITSQNAPTTVSYSITINPTIWGNGLPNYNFSDNVYNQEAAPPDIFWASGYFTLQNFVDTYLAQQYDVVSPNFNVTTLLQRYPQSSIYPNKQTVNLNTARQVIWKWIGATILSLCLFVPILSYLIELVRERQYLMKDLLEISGLMNVSYWTSYLVMIMLNGQFSMWIIIGLALGFEILTPDRVNPYAALMTVYIVGSGAFAMMFGFLVPRAEYYGLPIFVVTVAFTVGGAYLGLADNISPSLKLFFCFLSPSIGLTMGVLTTEEYLYYHNGRMDYYYVNENKNYPALASILGTIVASAVGYLLMTLILPLDWIFELKEANTAVMTATNKMDEIKYPCDNEEEQEDGSDDDNMGSTSVMTKRSSEKYLLEVNSLSQIYADGTQAVKDMSFRVKEGEVLSFLGSNGAGKSTTMKMLCGTLDATYGDAKINGYSITSQRVQARRNLGIAMQQDIIWDDVSVRDHLMLFGRLRGLHRSKLRTAVQEMLESLGFPEKAYSLASQLSGGQKRRLCVGISMIGQTSFVALDEPTAGLDPVARRQLWELVQKNRKGRAILLTTHFMDEADVLGDRIAIVKEGRLRAIGTAKFLKQRFGLGYLLRMSMQDKAEPGPVTQLIGQYIEDVSIASTAGTELSIRLPRAAVSRFPEMLESLEARSTSVGVLSFGIETTTLEEVFMRIVNEDTEQLLANHQKANKLLAATAEEREAHQMELARRDNKRTPLPIESITALLVKGRQQEQLQQGVNSSCTSYALLSLFIQTRIIIEKRYYQFVRSRGQWAMGFVFPIALAIVSGLLLSTTPTTLLGPATDNTYATYTSFYPTAIAGSGGEAATTSTLASIFGGNTAANFDYVGDNYTALFNTINAVSSNPGSGQPTVDSIFYDNLNDFTLLYNSSFPANLAGAVQLLLDNAISTATQNNLVIQQSYGSLPMNVLNKQLNNAFFVALIIGLIGGSFGAGLSIIVSGERVSMVKHQQLASGTSNVAYWLGSFISDFALIFFYILIFTAILAIFSPSVYTEPGYGYVVGAGFFYTLAVIFRFYIVSYFIPDVRMAMTTYFYGSLAIVYVFVEVWALAVFVTSKGNALTPTVLAIGMLFTILDPTFGFYLIVLYQSNVLGVLSQEPGKNVLSTQVGGFYWYMMMISTLMYGIIFIGFTENGFYCLLNGGATTARSLVDNNSNKPMTVVQNNSISDIEAAKGDGSGVQYNTLFTIPKQNMKNNNSNQRNNTTGRQSLQGQMMDSERGVAIQDPDVIVEREKVETITKEGLLDPRQQAIFLDKLRKVYYARGNVPSKVAVKDVSLCIPQGEIFGLLGANGAGKTTLLKMVSGLEQPTQGFAMIAGYDVVMQTSSAQRSMGLCPQFDTLIERLSVRENLLFFGRIKGIPDEQVVGVVEAFMLALNIQRYQHKLIQQLSGGNRRKVSLAVALIGNPPSAFIDEASTGLDPVASRLMWRLLRKIAEARTCAIILTTHNMIECQSVCSRVGIMKLGELVCLGDSQHLRSTHGTGFQLEVALKTTQASKEVQSFVQQHFPTAVLIEEHGTLLNFEIPRQAIAKLSQAFRLLESNKQRLEIEDYSLSQSTLEQVFLKQIRPNEKDANAVNEQREMDSKVPAFRDYATAYAVWLLAAVMPGLHHFYLGNTMRGVKYLCTLNEVWAGWLLDVFELHVLVQKSVQEYGSIRRICCCNCCLDNCCCGSRRNRPVTPQVDRFSNVNANPATAGERKLDDDDGGRMA